VHGVEQPLVAGDQRLAGLLGYRQLSRASIAVLQLVPKYQLNLRIDTKSSFDINSIPGLQL
jgi:hypothetical protein